jgi:hypothetical protein
MERPSACYGKMFPATLVKTANRQVKAKVFGYRVDHTGVVETRRTVTTDREAWRECTRCPDLDNCFRLSTGTLLMEIALGS